MKKVFLFVVLLLSISGYSQEDVLKDPDFLKFKEDYINLYLSDGFIRYLDVQDEFLKKRPDDYLENQDNYESWIKQNLSKSKFKNLDEALALHKELSDLTAIYEPQILKQFEMNYKLSQKHGEEEFREIYYREVQDAITEAFLVKIRSEAKNG
ncbi:hypothetical protein [Flavobacterium sp. I3-2]|uniref:hypothetical protein n=1 Tax=Flavobacterium sp. I3-2 TaxID=2748319 RepID=UPI0015AA8C84|nr:hypothetical protein [Flavobacterium sp. I3-2]